MLNRVAILDYNLLTKTLSISVQLPTPLSTSKPLQALLIELHVCGSFPPPPPLDHNYIFANRFITSFPILLPHKTNAGDSRPHIHSLLHFTSTT